MLQRVQIQGIELPRLYIAENKEDVDIARANGIPYIKWKRGKDTLIKYLLRPALEKMFPGIKWNKVLGAKRLVESEVIMVGGLIDEDDHVIAEYDKDEMLAGQLAYDSIVDEFDNDADDPDPDGYYRRPVDIALSERQCCGGNDEAGYDTFYEDRVPVLEYIGDVSSSVNIEVLQQLKLLPKFVGDITDCIKRNLSNNMYWTEGYNKKLGVPLGNFKGHGELPNLIILDISHSIPDGIASTMLALIDTLREQCNADLIITSARSGYYPAGVELPSPQTLRNYYGRGNEGREFYAILNKYIAGREFGHVITFGDNDSPGAFFTWSSNKADGELHLENTKVHQLHCYHTWQQGVTGYARWVLDCCPDVDCEYDTSWCNVMNKNIIWN